MWHFVFFCHCADGFLTLLFYFIGFYYFRELGDQVDVVRCDKNDPNDGGFLLQLSFRMNYDQMANAVATSLGVDPYYLQFFTTLG